VLTARRNIFLRRAADHRTHAALVTAQTRQLFAATLAAAGVETANEQAAKIDLVPRPKGQRPAAPRTHVASTEDVVRQFGQPEWGVQPDG
jgi:hypothetical protein